MRVLALPANRPSSGPKPSQGLFAGIKYDVDKNLPLDLSEKGLMNNQVTLALALALALALTAAPTE